MIIIPAVDIKNGKCVRLSQGRADAETVYGDDPLAMAEKWAQVGATRMHLIDLDGAFTKSPQNREAIIAVIDQLDVPVQVGGGIRNEETVRLYLEAGAAYVIIGTEAIKNQEWAKQLCRRYEGHIILGLDARQGMVAIEGWTQTTQTSAIELARQFENCGVAAINFTDIHRDGMQTGPNITATRQLAEAVSIPVVASGGVSCLDDIERLLAIESYGVTGVITGKALYSGALDLKAALELVGTA
jgi:phosphoribosylformimino-5-aminoimidazole carboxamide ribotide isomerase